MTKYFFVRLNLLSCHHSFFGKNFVKVIRRNLFFRILTMCTAQCGKLKNLLLTKKKSSNQLFIIFFSKNVTFTKFLSKKCDSSKYVNFRNFHLTMWILRNFCITFFLKNFRQNNFFSYEFYYKIDFTK